MACQLNLRPATKSDVGSCQPLKLNSYNTWQVALRKTFSYKEKHDELDKAECPISFFFFGTYFARRIDSHIGQLRGPELCKYFQTFGTCLPCWTTHRQYSLMAMGTVPPTTLVFTELWWIYLTSSELTKFSLWRKIHTCLPSRRCSKTSFCRQNGTSQLHWLSWLGFAHQFSNMQGARLCFGTWVTVEVLNTKVCGCGSNVDTRKLHGNSTNCYTSQERSHSEVLISLKLISAQTIN